MPAPTLGRIVHYALPWGAWRPAIVVGDPIDGSQPFLNLSVFLDGQNDTHNSEDVQALRNTGRLNGAILSVYSVPQGEGPGRWRWPPIVREAQAPAPASVSLSLRPDVVLSGGVGERLACAVIADAVAGVEVGAPLVGAPPVSAGEAPPADAADPAPAEGPPG